MTVAFVDIETTGLDATRHEPWEVAILSARGDLVVQLPIDLSVADPAALRLNRYYERRSSKMPGVKTSAKQIAELLAGAQLVGINPWFDAAFLDRFLRANGQAPAWHYRLICAKTLAAGYLGLELPWDTERLANGLGIDLRQFDQHTAVSDAYLAKALFESCYGKPPRITGSGFSPSAYPLSVGQSTANGSRSAAVSSPNNSPTPESPLPTAPESPS